MNILIRIQLILSLLIFALTSLLATGVQAIQESNVNVERLTVKSNMQLHLVPGTRDIIIKSIELTDDNYGHGVVTLNAIVIGADGRLITKQYKKNVDAGHDYYYEMLSGPLAKKK